MIDNGRFYYRGLDALAFADSATLEEAAALLWVGGGALPPAAPTLTLPRLRGRDARRGSGGRVGADCEGLIERCQIRLARLAAADLGALDLARDGVIRTGRAILSELAAVIIGGSPAPDPVHAQLAAHWRLDRRGADLVRRCLVLLADHELNASTFVARCVASTGATSYAVVAAALAALSGRRHGGASARAEALFDEIGDDRDPLAVMAARLARGEDVPGLGQPLYPEGDPRAAAISGRNRRCRAGRAGADRRRRRRGAPADRAAPERGFRARRGGERAAPAGGRRVRPVRARPHGRLDRPRDRAVRERGTDPSARPLHRPAPNAGLDPGKPGSGGEGLGLNTLRTKRERQSIARFVGEGNMDSDMSRRVVAEFFGTFWLTFGGCGSAVLAAGFPASGSASSASPPRSA